MLYYPDRLVCSVQHKVPLPTLFPHLRAFDARSPPSCMFTIRRICMALLTIEFLSVLYNRNCRLLQVVAPIDGNEQLGGGSLTWKTSWAHHESYGILDDISDISWKRMREHARNFHQYLPDKSGGPYKFVHNAGVWYIYNLQPVLNCP